MNKQKTLLSITLLAAILFIAAFLFKSFQVSNVEIVNYDPTDDLKAQEIKKKVQRDKLISATQKNREPLPQLPTRSTSQNKEDNRIINKLAYEERQKEISKLQTLISFYPSAEAMYSGILKAQEKGDDEKEDDLRSLLDKLYPDFEIPQ